METEFRTTFIPKKPIVPQSTQTQIPVSKPVGIFFVIAVIIFVVSLIIAGSAYGYKAYLQKDVADLSNQLTIVQRNLDPNTIKEFTVMDKRLRNSETLLNQHIVTSPLFSVLGATTLPTVRYTKMDMSFNEAGDLAVTMSGESDGYRSIALQSQALAQNATLNDTIFSNFTVTPKGRVSFDVAFVIPKADLVFTKNLDKNPAPINQVSNEQVLDSQSDVVAEATDIVTETSSVVEQSDSPNVR
jgi:hypothetical protein